ncbi:hypothetical protein BKA62DRAFT_682424 [Auriculariales sp. MPI-PUGE-AT-0066]|nr:hypothetical protein BKA62DRAFT_682424 [Auriculariales sp. MPI-PUGE-AT-0066]
MMESRKRPSSPVEDGPALKKRAIESPTGTPTTHTNGTQAQDSEEAHEDIDLEAFRKEAIYRRMRHYAREHARDQNRIEQLEAAKLTYHVGMRAIESCWSQLIAEMRALVPSCAATDSFQKANEPPEEPEGQEEITAFESALSGRREATRDLVDAFVNQAKQASPDLVAMSHARRKAAAEAEKYRFEADLLRKQLEEASNQLDKTRNELELAENRVEKLRRQAVLAPKSEPPAELNMEPAELKKEEPPADVVPPVEQPVVNGHQFHTIEPIDEFTENRDRIHKEREEEVVRLRQDVYRFKGEVAECKARLEQNERDHKESRTYLQLRDEKDLVEQRLEEALRAQGAAQKMADELKQYFEEQLAHVTRHKDTQTTELRNQVDGLQNEVARLRGSRDAIQTEARERESAMRETFSSLEEFKTLTDQYQRHIKTLQAEIQRLKVRIAANAGDEDLFKFFCLEDNIDKDYVESMRQRLADAEEQIRIMRGDGLTVPATPGETLESVSRKLAHYERLYGPQTLAASTPDIQALAAELKAKDTALKESELLRSNDVDTINALGEETDRLTQNLEAIQNLYQSKVFDLAALEEKVQKYSIEKAKADSKYFSTMRIKESLDAELLKAKDVIERATSNTLAHKANVEEIRKVQHQLEEDVKLYQDQIKTKDREYEQLQAQNKRLQNDIHAKNGEIQSLQKGAERHEGLHKAQAQAVLKLGNEQAAVQDKLEAARKQLEYAKKGAAAGGSGDGSMLSMMQKALKCSTCNHAYRDSVLITCGHTFCKNCIDARLTTRQRKCPACGDPFAHSDVLHIFLQ